MQFVVFPVFFVVFVGLDGRLQEDGDVGETGIAEQGTQAFRANDAFADTGVDIAMAAEGFFGIVEVQHLQTREANGLIEVVEDREC